MRTNLVQTCKTSANRINLNRTAMRVALIGLFISLGIGNAWGTATYKLQLKTVTQNNTGLGRVYASETTAAPEYSSYYTSKDPAYDAVTAASKEYYLWAVPTQRGVVFNNWTTSSTSSGSCTAGSSTLTDANKMQGAKVTVKAPTNADGTNTYTTTATVTANWKNQYSKVAVTYATPVDGKYRVTYEYSYLNTSTNALETGFTFDMDGSSAARSEDSYNNDVIILQSLDGVFEGWYNGSTLLSKNNPYTYVAPAAGGSVTISAHYKHVDKYYGKLTASIAEVPYSMPGGGTIFIANDPDVSGTHSADAQSVSNETYGESQNYYLHAQPNDKRYVFRGWYSDAACTSLISTDADYAYTFTSSSTNSASPTLGNVYAAFDFNLYYMQVEVEPAVPGLGMVLVKDNNTGTPEYTDYTTHAEQFLYAYRLAPTANAYLYAKPKYGYKFSGWYDNPDCTGTAKSTANPYTYAATGTSTDPMNPTIIKLYAKFVEDATTVNITYNLPDQTKGEYTASVLDIAEVDDDFIWTFTQVFTSEGKIGNTTQAQHKTDVLRLEAQPKAGYGVTSWTIAGAAKTTPSQLYETTGTAAATYGVTFGDAKPFLVSTNSTQYATLREALTAVGSTGKITVVQNAYVEAGNYTIPSGVTLLVPYESTGKSYTSPSTSYEKAQNFASATQYVLLTIGSGANIYLAGSIIVMADLCAPNGGGYGSGAPLSAYGRIAMSENSTITVNSGANLYCWGYITGIEGLVTAKSGATIHEIFQHQNNPGGTAASGWNEDAFFLNQYYVQNIESPLKIEYGASETVYAQMTVPSGSINNLSATLIDKDNTGMFALTSSGSYLIRTYNPSTDRITYDIYGNAKLNYISMSVYGMDLNTSKYVLPITSNMSVKCHPINGASSTFIVQYAVSFIPGAELIVDEGVTLNAQNKLIIYDREEWIDKGFAQFNLHSGGSNWSRSSFTPTRIYTRVKADLVDAKVDLNGTMNVSGSLYTTNSGADIISSNGTGVVKLLAAAPNNSNDIQYSSNKLGTSIKVPMTPAQLRNGDDSYTLTAGAVANDQFIYSKSQEKWLKNPKVVSWNANGGTTEASTLAYSEGAFVGELLAAYKDGYTLEGWYTAADGGTKIDAATKVTANITYYAHWTPKTYTISYRDQGGVAFSGTHVDSPTAHPVTHTFGTATALTEATKEHYTFGGWYRTPSCSGAVVTSITASECKNITLYAKWTIHSHNLTWDANGGELSGDYTSGTVNYGTAITAPTAFRENYAFNGWTPTPVETMPDEGDLSYIAQWEPAVASVTVSGNTTYYATIDAAFAYVNTVSANMTIKLLQDAPAAASLVYQPKSTYTCTLDLNNHTILGTFTKLINVNLKNAILTITDNSIEKGGKITTEQSLNGKLYGLFITAGKVNLNAGTIECVNTLQYNSTSAKSVAAYGVYVYSSAARYFTMNGGTVKANATYNAFGVYSVGTTNLKGGKIEVSDVVTDLKRNGTGYGVYVAGATTTISDDADISVNMKQKAYGVFIKAAAAIANITGGEILAKTASAKTAYGVYVDTGTFNAPEGSTTHVTADAYTTTAAAIVIGASGTVNIYDGTYEAKNTKSTGTTTYGVYSSGTTNIHGGTFNVTAKASTARAIVAWRNTTTVDGNPVFNVSAPATVYGATASGSTPTKAGAMYSGTLIVNGGTFNVTATSGETAYGVYAYAGTGLSMFSTTNDSVPGNYISAGEVNVSDGIFNVKAKTKAYGIVVGNGTQNKNTAYDPLTAYGQSSITGGKFKVETTGDANATAYAMNTKATATNLLVEGGKYSTKRTNASETSNIEDKYTAPTKSCNYHVLPLTGEDPYKYEVAEAYTITFNNYDGKQLQSGLVKKDETPAYSGEEPTKATDAQYTYTFKEWSPALAPVTVEATYTATYNTTINKYTVSVSSSKAEWGTVSAASVAEVPYGTAVTENGNKITVNGTTITATPAAATAQYTYAFSHWDNVPATVTGNVSIEAVFTRTTNTYTITWNNWTGANLETDLGVEYGATPTYNGATPMKAEDENYTYSFSGWDPAIAPVTGDATYTAQFAPVSKGFYVDIVDVDNSTKKLKLNVSGWPANGWPYYVNGTAYNRDVDRLADRTMWIPYTGEPGEEFPIMVRQLTVDGALISNHTYEIPKEVISNSTLSVAESNPLYVKGTTMTVSMNMTASNIYVAPDAKLHVVSGKTLTVDTIFLRTTPTSAAELILDGELNAEAHVVYTRIISSKSAYFQFGLPLDCDVKLEDIRLSNGTDPKYYTGSGWVLRAYDEERRANNGLGDNWVSLGKTDKIKGGKGYEMYSGMNYYREFYFPVDVKKLSSNLAVTYTDGLNVADNGWNMLVSPMTSTYIKEPMPEDLVISWMEADGFSAQEVPSSIPPAKVFAYQAATAGTISFDMSSNAPVRNYMAAAAEQTRIQWMHLDIKDANGVGDQTSIYSHPTRYEASYQPGIDVAKQSLTASRAIIYSSHAYGEMAFAGVADELLEQGVALTVYSPKEQELTISMRENDWLNRMAFVWLIDQATGAQIDLLESDYSFNAEAGTTAGRFILMGAFFAPQITTDNGNVQSDDEHIKAKKFIYNDKMYIQINGVIYDATGKLVK